MDKDQDVPDSYYCPLTFELMVDPVIDPDGHSYERTAIEEWLRINPVSPMTRSLLTIGDLRPNRALKESIDKIRDTVVVKRKAVIAPVGAGVAPADATDASIDLSAVRDGSIAVIRVIPSDGKARVPIDVVCVIDVSGSMNAAAELKTATGESESFGLSVLDIVKHAMKTIIASLDKNDRVAVVTFSDQAKVLMELTYLNDVGKKSAQTVVEAMRPAGSTNLWDGLFNGLEVLRKAPCDKRNRAIMLLTDGEPNIVPPRGHLPMLNNYKDKNDGLPGIIYTFGFGYRLDSALLVELAVGGNGAYSFIPDSSLVGTVFIHALSSLLTTTAVDVNMRLRRQNMGAPVSPLGGYPLNETDDEVELSLGTVLFGQSKDVVVDLGSDMFGSVSVSVTYNSVILSQKITKSIELNSYDTAVDSKLVEKNRLRVKAIEMTEDAVSDARINRFSDALQKVVAFSKVLKASLLAKDPLIRDLIKDVDGQITEALSRVIRGTVR